MDTLNCFYFALVGAGVLYAVIAMVTGGIHDVAGGLHLPVDIGGAHTTIDLGHGGDTSVPSLSPVTIATFVTAFGAFGIISQQGFGASSVVSLISAAAGGLVAAVIAHFAFGYFLIAPQGSTEVTQKDIVGATAEVITPIPANGMGEVAFVAQGARVAYPARSVDNQPIERRTIVSIVEIVGTIVSVRPR
ncbi:MAG: NfeD family protein [Chloroflexi bacterium]|nr:NfeD family protein [Chloroflexota bacterium]